MDKWAYCMPLHLIRWEAAGKDVVRMSPISSGIFQVSGMSTKFRPLAAGRWRLQITISG
jgi:hypothetical protein